MHERALGQARFAQSGLSRGDHFANAALRIAGEERADVLSHPGRANLARDAIRVFRCRELQDQDQMRVIDLRNTRGERPRVRALPRGGAQLVLPHPTLAVVRTASLNADEVALLRQHPAGAWALGEPARPAETPAAKQG